MRLHALAPLVSCLVLAACAVSLPPGDLSGQPHATVSGSHVDSPESVDTFRVTAIGGWPVNRTAEADPSKTFGVDLSNMLVPGRPVRVEFEGLARYRNAARTLFADPRRVEGSAEFVPTADQRVVVRGQIDAEQSTVWLEDERTHELIGRKFAAAPMPSASIPDMRTTTPDRP